MNKNCTSLKTSLIVIFSIISILHTQGAYGQYFWNTDFEYKGHEDQPRKWSIEGGGENYEAGVVSDQPKSGRNSLEISLKNAESYLILSISGNLVAGKRLEVEGYIRTLENDSIQAGFLLLSPGGGQPIVKEQSIYHNKNWEQISFTHSFPNSFDSKKLLIALKAKGTGKFWIDDFSIKIDGQEYGNASPDFREPTNHEIKSLNKHAIEIKSLIPSAPNEDLIELKKIVGEARVMALGENSHGSSPIYNFKLRIIQYLVTEMGFTVFALESPTVEADKINDYVMGGQRTSNELLRDLAYKSWQTKEMMNIIEWIKSYNETVLKKVAFRGLDMQNGDLALQFIYDFCLKYEVKLEGEIKMVDTLFHNKNKQEKDWSNLRDYMRLIREYLSTRNATDYNDLDETEFSRLNHYMTILSQSISLMNPFENNKNRDEFMADNIDWIKQNCGDCKIVVSADNDHIRKADGKTGYFLHQIYGAEYLALGMTFNKGTYAAYGPNEFYNVHQSYSGTYEYLFSKAKFDNFYIDLGTINDIPLLTKPSGFRVIGSRPQETTQFTEMDLKSNFDIMVYFEHSTHTKHIMK